MAFIDAKGDVTPAFAELMVRLAAAYPAARLTDAGIRVYARALGDLSLEQVRAAFGRAVKESAYFPTVAEIRRGLAPTAEDAGLLAWAAFERAAEDVGAYASVEVEDVAAARALTVVFGGWPQYCEQCGVTHAGEWAARRQAFLVAYRDARRAVTYTAHPPRSLPGLCAAAGDERPAAAWTAVIGAHGEVVPRRLPQGLPQGPAARLRLAGRRSTDEGEAAGGG